MKRLLALVLAVLPAVVSAAEMVAHPAPLPCDKEGKVIAEFVTRENFTFTGSTLLAKFPDGLLFKVGKAAPPITKPNAAMQDCVVMVPADSLPEAVRKSVGGFPAAAVAAAKKQRAAALEAGNKAAFPEHIVGGWEVQWYDHAEDPYGGKPGKAQSWEDYEAAVAKQKEKEPKPVVMTDAQRQAIADPAGTEWVWASGGKLELKPDGSARHSSWKKAGAWSRSPDGKIILTNERNAFTITFDDGGVGHVVGGDGKKTQIHFKAKKKPGGKPERAPSRLE